MVVTARMLSEKLLTGGEQRCSKKRDLADACGTNRHDYLFHLLVGRVGIRMAVAELDGTVRMEIGPAGLGSTGPGSESGKDAVDPKAQGFGT